MEQGALRASLIAIVGPRSVITKAASLSKYSRSIPILNPDHPDLVTTSPRIVVKPHQTSEVAAILRHADERSIPVYVSSGGTEVSGGSSPVKDGILIDMGAMKRILSINRSSLTARVEAACRLEDLERRLAAKGLRLGHLPMSIRLGVTAGGAASNYGTGVECSGFDTIADRVIGMEVVLPTGKVLRLKPTLKSSMGHKNLAWMFLGTEGMNGIITELTLRLKPYRARNRRVSLFGFSSFEAAVRASYRIYRDGVNASMMFAMNRERALWCVPATAGFEWVGGVLALAFDGPTSELAAAMERYAVGLLQSSNGRALEKRIVHDFQRNIFGRIPSTRRGLFSGQVGSATPSFLDCTATLKWYRDSRRICKEYGVDILGAAHLGPQHGFISIAHGVRTSDGEAKVRNIRCRFALIKRAMELGGSAESSHGVGLKNAYFLEEDLGQTGTRLMRKVKRMLDPRDILNPGKSWDSEDLFATAGAHDRQAYLTSPRLSASQDRN